MSFELDLFSINNIVIPTINIVNSDKKKILRNKSFSTEKNQNELFPLENIVVSEQKLKITKKFYKYEQEKTYKTTPKYEKHVIDTWNVRLLHRMRRSAATKNTRNERVYSKELDRYNEYIKYDLPAKKPEKPDLVPYPNVDADFIKKLWEIQEGKDAYTNQMMLIDSKLEAFNVSCDRVSSKLPYVKGNLVLCCYSTNMSKNDFDIYDDKPNSWANYITNGDLAKKQEMYERIDKIQKLSLLI